MAAALVFRLHDRGPELVREVLLERGWEEYDRGARQDQDWNLYWRGSAFHNSEYVNLLPWQRLNHHPKTAGITRKDFLARNLRRMRASFGSSLYDFSPAAFILPNDYSRFLAEYKRLRLVRGLSAYWICKPVDLSRGRGIFIFEDIKDLVYDCPVIVQRYVSDPLLISGYKFDLRIYVCVKSFHPLTVYIHQEGLVRFSTEKYNLSSLRNLYAHLTNTSINKFGPFYKTNKGQVGQGCKWTMSKFRHFLRSQDVNELLLWQRISSMVTLTLLAFAPSVPSCPNCVELFGFDVLIDARFRPWLLEVNYSPALTLDCQVDFTVKRGLISDLIDLMNYTFVDRLRERAYQKHPFINHLSHVSVPALSKMKQPKVQRGRTNVRSSKSQTLPHLRGMNHTPSRLNTFISDSHRHLPPVDTKQAAGIINGGATKTHSDLNLILGPRSRTNVSVINRQTCPALTWSLMDRRSLHLSEVTHRDSTETEAEAETDVSSRKPDTPQRDPGLRRSASTRRLTNLYSGRVKKPEETTAPNGQDVPPIRVGDFIRTFPFNAATLKASRHKLDVTTIIHELHKLTNQARASGQLDKTTIWRKEEEEEVKKDDEDDFDSLLWGPRDPPLIRHCFKST